MFLMSGLQPLVRSSLQDWLWPCWQATWRAANPALFFM